MDERSNRPLNDSQSNPSDWQYQQQISAEWYRQTFPERLRHTVVWVARCNHNLRAMNEDIANILYILEQAQHQPEMLPATIELIMLLHPWPLKLGHWVTWEQNLRFAIQACQSAGHYEWCARLLNDLSGMLLHCGRTDESLNLAQRAFEMGRDHRLITDMVAATGSIIDTLMYQNRSDAAEALLLQVESEPLIACLAGESQAEVMAQIALLHHVIWQHKSDYEQALRCVNEALVRLQPYADRYRSLYAHIYRAKGLIYRTLGKYRPAARCLRKAAAIFRQDGDRFAYSWALGNLGLVYWNHGDLLRAESVTAYSVRVAKRLSARWQQTCQIGNLGLVYLSQGRLKAARRLIETQFSMASSIGLTAEIARAQGNLGIVKLHQGNYLDALDALEKDRYLSEKQGSSYSLANTLANMARCLVFLGKTDDALATAHQGLDLAQQANSIPLQVMALRCLADCQPAEQRVVTLRRGLSLADGCPLDQAGCLLCLAHLSQDRSLWDRGVTLLDMIGATDWLQDKRRNPMIPYTIDNPPCIVALA